MLAEMTACQKLKPRRNATSIIQEKGWFLIKSGSRRREMMRADEVQRKNRVIQRSFWRAHRRNEKGDIDHSLIPTDIQAWYVDSSDEEDTVSERESDLETEEPSDVSDHESEADTD